MDDVIVPRVGDFVWKPGTLSGVFEVLEVQWRDWYDGRKVPVFVGRAWAWVVGGKDAEYRQYYTPFDGDPTVELPCSMIREVLDVSTGRILDLPATLERRVTRVPDAAAENGAAPSPGGAR